MNPSSTVDMDTLLMRIRAEAARRRQVASANEPESSADVSSASGAGLPPLPVVRLRKSRFRSAERYALGDFLALHDEDFVDSAYLGLLGRPADADGRTHFLDALRSGNLSKIEILGRLRYSREGRRRHAPVSGLLPAFAVQHAGRLPLIGIFVASLVGLIRLPRLVRSLHALEGYQHLRNAELEAAIRELALAAQANVSQIVERVDRDGASTRHLQASSAEQSGRVDALVAELRHGQQELRHGQQELLSHAEAIESIGAAQAEAAASIRSRLEALDLRIDQSETRERGLMDALALSQEASAQFAVTIRQTLGTLEQRAGALAAERTRSNDDLLRLIGRVARVEHQVHAQGVRHGEDASPQASPSAPVAATTPHRFDGLYFAFEQRFRGSREDIKSRVAYYLPLLRDSVVGAERASVLDIGCGRGEWLELLRDEGIDARGVDMNDEMANECISRGLEVEVGDAMDYLRKLPDAALGALTGFHIIEHVPLDVLIALLDEAHRVVRPGGIVIFETPNPENVIVGSCGFYVDPTHQRPLPPVLTQFLVETAGFVDVDIHRVNGHLLPQALLDPAEGDPLALRAVVDYLRGVFLCAPDYSVVARVA